MVRCGKLRYVLLAGALGALAPLGCDQPMHNPFTPAPAVQQEVPYPVSLMLPKEIRIHSFTGTKVFDNAQNGIEVHIEARDAYGDPTKAFGDFRFELYAFRPQNPDPKGQLITSWTESLGDPKVNALHWWNVSRTYVFKLQCEQPIKSGNQYVLLATYSSPYSERKFAQRVFTAGQ